MKIEILSEKNTTTFDNLFNGQFFWKNGFNIDEIGLKIDSNSFILCTKALNIYIYKEVNDVEQVIPLIVSSFGFYTNFSYSKEKMSHPISRIPNYDFFIYNNKIYVKITKESDINAICIAKIEDCDIRYFYETDTVSSTFFEHLPNFEIAQVINPVIKLEPQRKK